MKRLGLQSTLIKNTTKYNKNIKQIIKLQNNKTPNRILSDISIKNNSNKLKNEIMIESDTIQQLDKSNGLITKVITSPKISYPKIPKLELSKLQLYKDNINTKDIK